MLSIQFRHGLTFLLIVFSACLCCFQLVTLFSAPNYCGEFDNAGAVMIVAQDLTCSFQILPVSTLGYHVYQCNCLLKVI